MHLRPLYHTYHMSFLSDATVRVLLRLYLWAAQLLPDILIKTNEYLVSYRCLAVRVSKSGVSVCVC